MSLKEKIQSTVLSTAIIACLTGALAAYGAYYDVQRLKKEVSQVSEIKRLVCILAIELRPDTKTVREICAGK